MSHCHAADPNQAALPVLASKAVLASAARDHTTANALRARSAGHHSRNKLKRSRRIGVASRLLEAAARDLVAEFRNPARLYALSWAAIGAMAVTLVPLRIAEIHAAHQANAVAHALAAQTKAGS